MGERGARSPSLHSLQGCPQSAEAGAEHLDFVVMKRLVQRCALACYSDQAAGELAGVAKGAVGTRAVSWHNMDGVAEQGDVAGWPVLQGGRNGAWSGKRTPQGPLAESGETASDTSRWSAPRPSVGERGCPWLVSPHLGWGTVPYCQVTPTSGNPTVMNSSLPPSGKGWVAVSCS